MTLEFQNTSRMMGLRYKNVMIHNIEYHVSQPRKPNENPAEGAIREIKRR